MTEDVQLALIICGTLLTVVVSMTAIITVCAWSQELVQAWKEWKKGRDA